MEREERCIDHRDRIRVDHGQKSEVERAARLVADRERVSLDREDVREVEC